MHHVRSSERSSYTVSRGSPAGGRGVLASFLPAHVRIRSTLIESPSLKREIDCEKRDLAIALDGRWFLASSNWNHLFQGRRFMRVILVSAVASALLVGI